MNGNTEKFISIHASSVAEQSKYVYFILTFSVSAIGFWIYMTANLHIAELNWKYYFLFGCVFFWVLSILFGMRNRRYILLSAHSNMTALLVDDDEHYKTSVDKHIAYKKIMKMMENNSEKADSYFKLQAILFIIGTIIFSVWHILQIFPN